MTILFHKYKLFDVSEIILEGKQHHEIINEFLDEHKIIEVNITERFILVRYAV